MTPAAVVPPVPTTMKGRKPLFRSSATRLLQFTEIHFQIAVCGDGAHGASSQPRHVRDLVEGVMRFFGEYRCARYPLQVAQAVFSVPRKSPGQGHDDRGSDWPRFRRW